MRGSVFSPQVAPRLPGWEQQLKITFQKRGRTGNNSHIKRGINPEGDRNVMRGVEIR